MTQSLEYKSLGNQKFAEEDFVEAIKYYTMALHLRLEEPEPEASKYKSIVLSNRAAAYIRMGIKENFEIAIGDCTKGIVAWR